MVPSRGLKDSATEEGRHNYGVSLMGGGVERGTSHCLLAIIWHLPYNGREFEKATE